MERDASDLRRSIERYEQLLSNVSDERVCRELERLIAEAHHRLEEIERRE
jgi:predicted  nucleic acid-binding Zn-ribbon protein